MSKLSCSMNSCYNNCDGGCCLSEIKVSGRDARTSEETRCSNYRPLSEGPQNSVTDKERSYKLDISCSACECKYNEDEKCISPSVCIDHSVEGSECQTFTPRA